MHLCFIAREWLNWQIDPKKIVCSPFSLKSEMRDKKKCQGLVYVLKYGPDLMGMPMEISVSVVGGSERNLGLNEAKMANKQTALGKKNMQKDKKRAK